MIVMPVVIAVCSSRAAELVGGLDANQQQYGKIQLTVRSWFVLVVANRPIVRSLILSTQTTQYIESPYVFLALPLTHPYRRCGHNCTRQSTARTPRLYVLFCSCCCNLSSPSTVCLSCATSGVSPPFQASLST